MSTKYSVSKAVSWRNEVAGRPRLSDHALNRWDERMPAGAVSPERAWSRAVQLRDPMTALVSNGDMDTAALFAETVAGEVYGAVFLLSEDSETTVRSILRVRTLQSEPQQAYLWARAAEVFDVDW